MQSIPALMFLAALTLAAPFASAGDAVAPVSPPPTPEATQRPVLGVIVDPVTFDNQSLVVKSIEAATTAATLGLKAGDIITSINGKPLKTQEDLGAVMATLKYGDAIKIDVLRNKEPKALAGTLQPRLSVDELWKLLQDVRQEMLILKNLVGLTKREPTLAEVLQQLKELEDRMPAAIAQFKKQYPNGEFSLSIKIDIVSDKTAKNPIEILPKPAPDPGAKKPDAPKDPKAVEPPLKPAPPKP